MTSSIHRKYVRGGPNPTPLATCTEYLSKFGHYAVREICRREHGLCDDSLHDIFRAVAVAKLMYASDAWWGFSNANDRQKIFAFIRRCIRTGFYRAMLCIRGTSHGPVSVCLSVRHKSEFY